MSDYYIYLIKYLYKSVFSNSFSFHSHEITVCHLILLFSLDVNAPMDILKQDIDRDFVGASATKQRNFVLAELGNLFL